MNTSVIQFEATTTEVGNMDDLLLSELKVDRQALQVLTDFDSSDEKAFWLSRTPHDRLRHVEVLRRINYGDQATARLQRVLELAEQP